MRIASRGAWAALLGIHAPIVLELGTRVTTEGPTGGAVGGLAVLVPALVLFALKLIDVPWLRLPRRRHSFIALCVVTAMVHHEALTPAAGETALFGATTAIVVTTALAPRVTRSRRLPRLRDLLRAALAPVRRPAAPALALSAPVLVHGPLRVRPPATVPRGPPR